MCKGEQKLIDRIHHQNSSAIGQVIELREHGPHLNHGAHIPVLMVSTR